MQENENTSHDKKKRRKRELIEWGLIIVVAGGLYLTGYHTEVIGFLQRGLLATRIIQPDTTPDQEDIRTASYDLYLKDQDGNALTLHDYKGKTIFINFWATWCPPCIAEMPNLQDLYNELSANPDIEFLFISLDEDPETVLRFFERKEYDVPVYYLNGRKPGVYDSSVVPTTYVISPDGRIVVEKRGMAHYNTASFKEFLTNL